LSQLEFTQIDRLEHGFVRTSCGQFRGSLFGPPRPGSDLTASGLEAKVA
jgi:hypothetical protein